MGRHVPPRVAYWTSSFQSDTEAVAGEVRLLRRRFRSSVAWGLSHRRWAVLSWRRGFGLHPRLHLLFRAATRLLEPVFHLNHLFGSVGDWFYLAGARRRPAVLTMATAGPPVRRSLLDRVDRFVAEYPAGRVFLERLGIDRGRVRLIFPPVDLARFSPRPAPDGPFRVLFASSPDDADWLEARGVPLILDAAALRPRFRFRLLWRPWGDSAARVLDGIQQRGLTNVELVVSACRDMAAAYNAAHVCVAPFTDATRCKPAPNSVVESLACGRPVLVTETVGLADLVREGRAGSVCPPSGAALAEHLDVVRADWHQYAANARALAERWFGEETFLGSYQRLYEEVLAR